MGVCCRVLCLKQTLLKTRADLEAEIIWSVKLNLSGWSHRTAVWLVDWFNINARNMIEWRSCYLYISFLFWPEFVACCCLLTPKKGSLFVCHSCQSMNVVFLPWAQLCLWEILTELKLQSVTVLGRWDGRTVSKKKRRKDMRWKLHRRNYCLEKLFLLFSCCKFKGVVQ